VSVTTVNVLRLVTVAFAAIVVAACEGRAQAGCDDLLAALKKKPDTLEYRGCKERSDLQGKPWQASYRVPGARAADVERYLAKELTLKTLRRTCCLWESVENSFRDTAGRLFLITMSSEETAIDTREDWGKIPYFYVTVNRYREDP
jgi:hypothetical protein